MTKRKANPQPHRFQPGNKAAAKDTTLVGIRIMVRPDQRDWMTQQPTTISETGRQAIDLLISSRDGKKEE